MQITVVISTGNSLDCYKLEPMFRSVIICTLQWQVPSTSFIPLTHVTFSWYVMNNVCFTFSSTRDLWCCRQLWCGHSPPWLPYLQPGLVQAKLIREKGLFYKMLCTDQLVCWDNSYSIIAHSDGILWTEPCSIGHTVANCFATGHENKHPFLDKFR